MKRVIYNINNLKIVGVIQNNTNFEWELNNNVIPNFGGTIEDYAFIETNLTYFKLNKNNGVVEVSSIEAPDVVKKNLAKKELAELLKDFDVLDLLLDVISTNNLNYTSIVS